MRQPITSFLAALLVCLSASPASARQSAAPLVVANVEVAGARRYTVPEVTKLSGLELGKTVTTADLEAAIQRMAATGLFKNLNYRYVTAAGRTTVTFDIEESDWTMPVVFDNFVWFKDAELIAALKQSIPSFDGTTPVTEGSSDLISRELQKVIAARKIPGRIDFVPQGTIKEIESFAFRVVDPAPKLCSIGFSGAAAIQEQELVSVFAPVVGADYSRSYVAGASRGTIVDLYRRRGHWRAGVAPPTETLVTSSACTGAAVTLAVTEGVPYTWDRAEWIGNVALSSRDLDAVLPIRSGDVANLMRIDDGVRRIHAVYGKQGYIGQRASYVPRLDDATRRAVFEIKIEEGLQFRMGTITFAGLSEADAAMLSKRWQLKPGAIFDASYFDKYYAEEIQPRLPRGSKPPGMETRVDEVNRVVNIRFVFGG